MIGTFFLFAILIYSSSSFLSYSQGLKHSPWFYVIGLTLSIMANSIWLTIAKKTHDPSKLILYGLYWDTIITLSFLLIPMLFFDIRLTWLKAIGIALILIGIVYTKL